MSRVSKGAQIFALISLFVSLFYTPGVRAQEGSRYFPETKQTVKGRFLQYWEDNGGLMQQGYPISGELQEVSEIDGKTYTVQYFERAVFEMHPENARPFDVLLSLLGVMEYKEKYPNGAPNQRANDEAGSVYFPETGKRVGGSFLAHFNQFGGVPQQGLPISDEFQERSELDGKVRVVQYFERAVFEWNPSNTPPYNVLLAQLGTFAYRAHQQVGEPLPEPNLPPPAGPNKSQLYPQSSGSGRYIVWQEMQPTDQQNRHENPYEHDLRALDRATNAVTTIGEGEGDQTVLALDESVVAWRSSCSGCDEVLYATDMATGQRYELARTTPGQTIQDWTPGLSDVAVAGRTVAWMEYLKGGIAARIVAKNVDTGGVIEVRAVVRNLPNGDWILAFLQGSGKFLSWQEFSFTSMVPGDDSTSSHSYNIQVYDLVSRKLSTVLSEQGSGSKPIYRLTSLDGDRLVVNDAPGHLLVINLADGTRSGLSVVVELGAFDLYGDRLLVYTDNSEVYGLNVSRPEQLAELLLSLEPGMQPVQRRYAATLSGDWLVWSTGISPALFKKTVDF